MSGKKSITRRDFLDGAAVAIATTAVSSSTIAATAVGGSEAAKGRSLATALATFQSEQR